MMLVQMAPHSEKLREWAKKQEHGLRDYIRPKLEGEPYFRRLAIEFRTFCDPSGLILDLGCGIEPQPAYAVSSPRSTYVGIDPLQGCHKRTFDFVRAIGEALPFGLAMFDWVLCATALDHFLDPLRALAEARTILKPSGRLGLWIGVVDWSYFHRMYAFPSLRDRRNWARLSMLIRHQNYRKLATVILRHLIVNRVRRLLVYWRRWTDERRLIDSVFAERAMGHFHFYKEEEILAVLDESGFQVVRHGVVADAEHGNSLFVVARPGL